MKFIPVSVHTSHFKLPDHLPFRMENKVQYASIKKLYFFTFCAMWMIMGQKIYVCGWRKTCTVNHLACVVASNQPTNYHLLHVMKCHSKVVGKCMYMFM